MFVGPRILENVGGVARKQAIAFEGAVFSTLVSVHTTYLPALFSEITLKMFLVKTGHNVTNNRAL